MKRIRAAFGLAGVLMTGITVRAYDDRAEAAWKGWSMPRWDGSPQTAWDRWSRDVSRWPEDLRMKGVRGFDAGKRKSRVTDQGDRLRDIERKLDRILEELEALKRR
jgi:hypothetical protein